MRSVVKAGDASGNGLNIRGRFITPWRENFAAVINQFGVGEDNPALYPFDPMTLRQFSRLVWRIQVWRIRYTVAFNSLASGFTYTRSADILVPAMARSPLPPNAFEELGSDEEWRLMGGFQFQYDFSGADPLIPGSIVNIQARIAGDHQYLYATANNPQRFRPQVFFNYSFNYFGDDTETDFLSFGVLSNRITQQSIGTSRMLLPSYDETVFPSYNSAQNVSGITRGTFFIIAPATFSASITIEPLTGGWWAYADANGLNPIWSTQDGSQLADWRTGASREVIGRPIISEVFLSGRNWIA